ncbi:MAG: hypothetical protein NUV67_00035 [archaeon]|nr:hypothetical protein [archaeon]
MEPEKVGAALLVLALAFILIELPHLESGLPLHSDEYDNTATAKRSLEEGRLYFGDPYAPPAGSAYSPGEQLDFESGYIAIMAAMALLVGYLNLHLIVPFLVFLFVLFSAFLLVKKLCGHEFVAFCAVLFLFFLPSYQNTLGPVFLVASNLGLALFALLLLFGFEYLHERRSAKKLLATGIGAVLIYPPSLALAAISLLGAIIFSPQLVQKNKRELLISGGLLALTSVMYILVGLFFSGLDVIGFLQSDAPGFFGALGSYVLDVLVFRKTVALGIPNLYDYIGLPLFALGIASIAYFGQKTHRLEENQAFFIPAAVVSVIAILGVFWGAAPFVFPERYLLFAGFLLLLCAGALAGEILLKAQNLLAQTGTGKKYAKIAALAQIFFVLLVGGIAVASNSFDAQSAQLNVQESELEGIAWLSQNTQKASLVFAAPYMSKPIYVLADRAVFCTTATRFGCPKELVALASSFFFASCEDREKILSDYFRADYVLLQKELDASGGKIFFPQTECGFLEKVYEGTNIIIYKTKSLN